MKAKALLTAGLISALTLSSCSEKTASEEEVSMPLIGYWQSPDNCYNLFISSDSIHFLLDEMDGFSISCPYTKETPDKLSFTVDNFFPGSIQYNKFDKTLTFKIEDYDNDTDFVMVIPAQDRFDRVTPKILWTEVRFKSLDNDTPTDTLPQGHTLPWITDTLQYIKVAFPDGRTGYGDKRLLEFTRGTLTEEAFNRNYAHKVPGEAVESLSFEKKDNMVTICYNYMKDNGSGAWEIYYVGEVKGCEIEVKSQFNDSSAYMDNDLSNVTPLEEPFTLFVIDNDQPRVIKGDDIYVEREL